MHSRHDPVIFIRKRARHYRHGPIENVRRSDSIVSPRRMVDFCPRSSGIMRILYALADNESARVPCFQVKPDGTIIQHGDPYRYGADVLYDLPASLNSSTAVIEFIQGEPDKVSKKQKEAAKALVYTMEEAGFRLNRELTLYGPGVKEALGLETKGKQPIEPLPDLPQEPVDMPDSEEPKPRKPRKPRHRKASVA